MVIILTDENILSSQQVCQSCLLADSQGSPRWRQGRLCCGHSLRQGENKQANLYECQMGFRVTNIE